MSLIYLLSLLFAAHLAAAAVNRTVAIDDTYGDAVTGALPVYSPPGNWSQGQPCSFDDYDCLINPDPSMARNGTWHDSVGTTDDAPPRTVDLNFEGNYIAVYCIISEVDQIQIAVSNMTFELDGQQAGKFFHDVTGETDAAGHYDIHYNVLVFNGTVPQGNHSLRINSVGYSRMLFDYALYTTTTEDLGNTTASPTSVSGSGTGASPSPNSPPSSHVSVGVIAGATAAGVVSLLGIGILLFGFLRRRRRYSSTADHIDSGGPRSKRWSYEQDDTPAADRDTLAVPLPYDSESPASFTYPYSNSGHSHYHHSAASSREPSPSDSAVPLMEFSGINTDPFTRGHQPRLVVIGTETRLEGPENSMTRLARTEVAKREAELTQRVREVEQALATRHPPPSASEPSASTSPTFKFTVSAPSRASTMHSRSGEGEPDAALRDELNELRAEMERMRNVQQQMTLELRDATEPPPSYQ